MNEAGKQMKKTKKIKVGSIYIGGDAPVTVQSMLNIPADDIDGSVKQAIELQNAGCDIIRAAVPDIKSVALISALKNALEIPVVADIHFDYRIAIECAHAGVDKIRINPGNIGSEDRVKAVADICNAKSLPIRIGVNSGSLERHILEKHGAPTPQAICESALYHASLLERFDFNDIVLSLKSSDVISTISAYRLASEACDYPLHLGVTEAGTEYMGIIKSSAGIGSLLVDGIGNTIRFSLTADPIKEVKAGKALLHSLGLTKKGISFVSCPTCGRTKIDLISLAKAAEERLENCHKNIIVAIMGCAVNGPGEAKHADIGIAAGDGCGLIFKKGEIVKKVKEDELLNELVFEIEKM